MEREANKQTISEVTRRDVTDYISAAGVSWAGRLEEPDFLSRIWRLAEMPSGDGRFPDAAGDIWQHRVNNYDWEDDWVFDDPRFELRRGPDELFVRFLCEMLHPVVRPDTEAVEELLSVFNEYLAHDDWEIIEISQLSGKPVFEGRRRDALKVPLTALELDSYERLDRPEVVRDHLRRIESGLRREPAAAIASSKELVESVCQIILDDYGTDYGPRDDVLDLYKKVALTLKLNAESVPESAKGSQASQRTLRTLVTTIQSLAELRNELGLGHGRNRRSPALARHGRLAFNASVTVTEFLLDTWHARRALD